MPIIELKTICNGRQQRPQSAEHRELALLERILWLCAIAAFLIGVLLACSLFLDTAWAITVKEEEKIETMIDELEKMPSKFQVWADEKGRGDAPFDFFCRKEANYPTPLRKKFPEK